MNVFLELGEKGLEFKIILNAIRANTFQPINFNVGEQNTQFLCADPWST